MRPLRTLFAQIKNGTTSCSWSFNCHRGRWPKRENNSVCKADEQTREWGYQSRALQVPRLLADIHWTKADVTNSTDMWYMLGVVEFGGLGKWVKMRGGFALSKCMKMRENSRNITVTLQLTLTPSLTQTLTDHFAIFHEWSYPWLTCTWEHWQFQMTTVSGYSVTGDCSHLKLSFIIVGYIWHMPSVLSSDVGGNGESGEFSLVLWCCWLRNRKDMCPIGTYCSNRNRFSI